MTTPIVATVVERGRSPGASIAELVVVKDTSGVGENGGEKITEPGGATVVAKLSHQRDSSNG